MKIRVRYYLTYSYNAPVSLSRQEFRVIPRQDHFLQIEEFDLQCEAAQKISYRRDQFDNEFVMAFFLQDIDKVDVKMSFCGIVQDRNPFDFLLDKRGVKLPISLTEVETETLLPYLKKTNELLLPKDLHFESGAETVRTLTKLSSWHFENIQYERRDDGPARPAHETLALKSGACRDTAVLFAEILHIHGIPARLVSGFLAKSVDDPAEHRADNALHAWVDAFLPGAGWVGFDPTNGVMCDHHYLATAVGPDMESIMPIKGNYFSNSSTPSQLDAKVEVSVEL